MARAPYRFRYEIYRRPVRLALRWRRDVNVLIFVKWPLLQTQGGGLIDAVPQ